MFYVILDVGFEGLGVKGYRGSCSDRSVVKVVEGKGKMGFSWSFNLFLFELI